LSRSATAGGDVEAVVADAAATDAVRLFVDRAASVAPGFSLEPGNVASVSEICRRLDGIPLAIELAAARVSSMSPDDIARRLGDRFRLLAGGRRTAVPRQQTLHALIDWSWDLLTDADRRLLRRLSIFAGGWTVAEAAAVVGDGDEDLDEVTLIDGLGRLVDRSLVLVDRGLTTRYRMLETIRQYAREKLIAAGEVGEVADRHLAAFLALALEAEPALRGPAMADWLDRLDTESDNIEAALEWGLEASPWSAVQLVSALLGYWGVRVPSESTDERIVAAIEIARTRTLADGEPAAASREELALAARLLGEAGRVWSMSGRAAEALPWARDATLLADASGDDRARIAAMVATAVGGVFGGAPTDPAPLFASVVDLAELVGDPWTAALAGAFGGAGMSATDPAAGDALLARGEAASVRSGSPQIIASAALARGRYLDRVGLIDEALDRFDVAVARFAELGDERLVLAVRSDRTHALRRAGRLDEALAAYRDTILGWVRLGNAGAVANQLESFAFVAVEQAAFDRAARLLGAAESIRTATASPMAPDERLEHDRYAARVRADGDHAAAFAAGARLSMADAVALARSA
jgi:tetratricopeptide (TPR) repeat protein